MISLLAAAAALSRKIVSLHDFALGCRCRLVIFLPAFDVDAVMRFSFLSGMVCLVSLASFM